MLHKPRLLSDNGPSYITGELVAFGCCAKAPDGAPEPTPIAAHAMLPPTKRRRLKLR
jgi:hypothetical protein